jgi:DNA-binding winged helix-turn-helix (wHTH) protein
MVYRFLNIDIDRARFALMRGSVPIKLEPRVLELIIYLIERRHRMVSTKELLAEVWSHQAIGPSVLQRAICLARKALDAPEAIQTIHARGYRWGTPVDTIGDTLNQSAANGEGYEASTIDAQNIPRAIRQAISKHTLLDS